MKLTSLWLYKKKMEAQISPLLKAFWLYELDFILFFKTWIFYMPEAKIK